jgi:hypothetical protein
MHDAADRSDSQRLIARLSVETDLKTALSRLVEPHAVSRLQPEVRYLSRQLPEL